MFAGKNNVNESATEASIPEGALYIVATPIGHLDDLSVRARTIFTNAALIAAEDTRRTGQLLSKLATHRPLVSLHEHNETARIDQLLARLAQGEAIALVADAGTPLISDPGYALVRAAHRAGIRVVPIPGPCALIAALSASGLPTDRFAFEGFLPAKTAARRRRLEALKAEPRTLIFYEAIHRLVRTLKDLSATFGENREACLAREMTKLHETITSATLGHLQDQIDARPDTLRGELVLVVAGATNEAKENDAGELDALLAPLLSELPLKQAVRLVTQQSGQPRNTVYSRALTLNKRGANR